MRGVTKGAAAAAFDVLEMRELSGRNLESLHYFKLMTEPEPFPPEPILIPAVYYHLYL